MKRSVSSVCLGLLLFLIGCDDVFEEDISDDVITIIAPLDMAELEGNGIQFRWNYLEGADNYRIQILDNQQSLVLDSLVNTAIFDYLIEPGAYKWRLRGENFAYTTPYTIDANFSIQASADLSNQIVGLSAPINNLYTNETALSFSWQAINTADAYNFQLIKKEGVNDVVLFEDTNVSTTSISLQTNTIMDDAEYVWQVQGKNATSTTPFSKRTFYIDRTNPPAPTLSDLATNQNFNVNDELTFTWSYDDVGEILSDITSTIEISSNENFTTITKTENTITKEFKYIFDTSGTFYWRVRGEDKAGNKGENSAVGSVTIN